MYCCLELGEVNFRSLRFKLASSLVQIHSSLVAFPLKIPLQVTKSQREVEREIRNLERQEKQLQLEAKKLAQKGQVRMHSVKAKRSCALRCCFLDVLCQNYGKTDNQSSIAAGENV